LSQPILYVRAALFGSGSSLREELQKMRLKVWHPASAVIQTLNSVTYFLIVIWRSTAHD